MPFQSCSPVLLLLVVATTLLQLVHSIPHLPRQQQAIPTLDSIPDYVLEHAPYFYLSSEEQWWPTDVAAFLPRVIPEASGSSAPETTATLSTLSTFSGQTYLTSPSGVTLDTDWVKSDDARPDAVTGHSSAPCTIIVVPKLDDTGVPVVDAFYFAFFAYNAGPSLLDRSSLSFGNHVGDWEHTMVRFVDGTPTTIYLSQHGSGSAFTSGAMPAAEGGSTARPLVYPALGSHAMYPSAGTHVYEDLLADRTDAGSLWDPTLNFRAYLFDASAGTFTAAARVDASTTASDTSTSTGAEFPLQQAFQSEGVEWLTFTGYWGDERLSQSDPRQLCLFGQCRYTEGPHGPYLKNLGRKKVCQDEEVCEVQQSVPPTSPLRSKE